MKLSIILQPVTVSSSWAPSMRFLLELWDSKLTDIFVICVIVAIMVFCELMNYFGDFFRLFSIAYRVHREALFLLISRSFLYFSNNIAIKLSWWRLPLPILQISVLCFYRQASLFHRLLLSISFYFTWRFPLIYMGQCSFFHSYRMTKTVLYNVCFVFKCNDLWTCRLICDFFLNVPSFSRSKFSNVIFLMMLIH